MILSATALGAAACAHVSEDRNTPTPSRPDSGSETTGAGRDASLRADAHVGTNDGVDTEVGVSADGSVGAWDAGPLFGPDAAFADEPIDLPNPFGDASAPLIDNGSGTHDAGVELLFKAELVSRAKYWATPIRLQGRVITQSGKAVANARVSLGDRVVTTGADGRYALAKLRRKNAMLRIEADGYKPEIVYAHMARPYYDSTAQLDSTVLVQDDPNVVRFLFGGDTSFGRRFLDPEELTHPLDIPPSNPSALIDSADPAPGSIKALSYVAPLFQLAEFATVNLETPVTNNLVEYHSNKDYVFFTLPQSLEVFATLGVHYVNLGNNHVFDYLTQGLIDTLQNLDDYGLANSGAGLTVADAFRPYRETLGGSDYSFISATSVDGIENPPLYVAAIDAETGEEKGGAANLQETERVKAVISGEREAGYLPIVQWHTGAEYTYWPTDYARERMSLALQSGAALVVSHHPHVAQGFAFEAEHLIVEGLGNLCFDQARHETMLGLLSTVDLDGEALVEARGIPVYLEDFRPRPIAGELSRLLLRRIAEQSENAHVVIENNWGHVVASEPPLEERSLDLNVQVGATGNAVVDLRQHLHDTESIVSASAAEGVGSLQAGEDLLLYGDFEDWDIDEDNFELGRWDITGPSSYPCLHEPHRGAAALCSYRSSRSDSVSSIAFRNRVRVLGEAIGMPNKDLSFVGYARADNAGAFNVEMRYYASEGEREFGEEIVLDSPGGDFDWQWFTHDLDLPPDEDSGDLTVNSPHALRFFIRHNPPAEGRGIARFDDLAIVSWRAKVSSLSLALSNPIQFVKLNADPGSYTLHLDIVRSRPRR